MGRLLPRNQALDDQVLALLTGSFMMKTHEVAAGLGWRMTLHDSERANCEGCDAADCHPGSFLNFHHGPVRRRYTGPDVRPNLERLARAGKIEKLKLPGDSWVYWRGPGAEW